MIKKRDVLGIFCFTLHGTLLSRVFFNCFMGFPDGSVGKESTCKAGDSSSIPGLGGFPGEGNGNPLQYSCLGNPMGRRGWWTLVHGVAKAVNTT